jgi:Zn-finger nucleic acid-binding protein
MHKCATILAMNCRNCGGAMELFATRGYFFCRYCGSFHFPETTADQGVRVVAESRDPLPCPLCRTTLAAAVLDELHAVHYCQTCRGVLLNRGSFADVVQQRRAWASGAPAAPVPLRQEELTRKVTCPKCSAPLSTHPYYGPGNVVIDSCGTCDVVWLDFGELKQIVDAPGRDRGGRELPARRDVDTMPDPTASRMIGTRDTRDSSGNVDLLGVISELFSR